MNIESSAEHWKAGFSLWQGFLRSKEARKIIKEYKTKMRKATPTIRLQLSWERNIELGKAYRRR